MDSFSFGIANRGASIRIGRETEADGFGYLEDRRYIQPYFVYQPFTNHTNVAIAAIYVPSARTRTRACRFALPSFPSVPSRTLPLLSRFLFPLLPSHPASSHLSPFILLHSARRRTATRTW